jgi:hypothetical protein
LIGYLSRAAWETIRARPEIYRPKLAEQVALRISPATIGGERMSEFLYDVFLSYARRDPEIELDIERLAQAVKDEFVRVTGGDLRIFIDKSIHYGDSWPNALEDALASSKVLLACLSPAYFQSEWCRKEWMSFFAREGAAGGRTLIFPVRLRSWERILDPPAGTTEWIADAETRQMPEVGNLLQRKGLGPLVESILLAIGSPLDRRPSHVPPGRRAIRLGTNRTEFERRLAIANRITIVGVTLQNLKKILMTALDRRKAEGNQEPWSELRIVALDDQMLGLVHDESSGKDSDAVIERKRLAKRARFELARWLEHNLGSFNWTMYEYPYLLPFVGAFFDLPDGQKVAQIANLAPGRPAGERLYLEFDSFLLPGETSHFESTFTRIVEASRIVDEIVVVGRPSGDDFLVAGGRRRGDTWKAKGNGEMVAAVIALLWQQGLDGVQPLLQVRTPENSRREIHYLSNLSGFINVHDLRGQGSKKQKSYLTEEAQQRAVNREIGEELNQRERCWKDPVRAGQARYYFADSTKEAFVFFLYTVEMTASIEDLAISAQVQLKPWALSELIELRRLQVLRLAVDAISHELSGVQLKGALRVARLNLLLHEEPALADLASKVITTPERKPELIDALRNQMDAGKLFDYSSGVKLETRILGLAGLQYREFFSKLVPAYAGIGVPEAAACQNRTQEQAHELALLHGDLDFVRRTPIGLDGLHMAPTS